MKNTVSATAVALAIVAAPVVAADGSSSGSPLNAGDRVRVSAATIPAKSVGEVVEVGPDALKIRLAGRTDPVTLSAASIDHLERSLGRHNRFGKGALVGGLVGSGVAVALGLIAGSTDDGCGEGPCGLLTLYLAGVFGGAGALMGGVVGAGLQTERWETVSGRRASLGVIPHRKGAGVALSVRF